MGKSDYLRRARTAISPIPRMPAPTMMAMVVPESPVSVGVPCDLNMFSLDCVGVDSCVRALLAFFAALLACWVAKTEVPASATVLNRLPQSVLFAASVAAAVWAPPLMATLTEAGMGMPRLSMPEVSGTSTSPMVSFTVVLSSRILYVH